MTAKSKIFQWKVQLREVRPPVWRRLQVPGDMRLDELHAVVQVAMGWLDCHLHEFEVDGVRYGVPDDDWGFEEVRDEARVKLFRVAGEGTRLRYAYDFGDDWKHDIVVEQVLSPEPGVRYPRCLAGRRACPPEDVGGSWGYGDFLAAMADPDHEEHEHYLDWVGGAFNPDEFDVAAVDRALDLLAWSAAPAQRSGERRRARRAGVSSSGRLPLSGVG